MKARSIVLTEIYPKFAKLFIQIAGPKNIQPQFIPFIICTECGTYRVQTADGGFNQTATFTFDFRCHHQIYRGLGETPFSSVQS